MAFPKAAVGAAIIAALLPPLLMLATTAPSSGSAGLCPDALPPTNPHHRAADGAAVSSAVEVATGRFGTVRAEPCRSFSESYREARHKFLTAAEEAGAEVTSLEVTRRGGEAYHMDAAVLRGGGSSSKGGGLVMHTSGVHGVEGYAGSAVQVAALRHLASFSSPEARAKALGSTTIVFIHAVNPFGMATFRRTNENNVDLNRNALDEDGWREVLARDPNLAGYDDFDASFFNPRRGPTELDAAVKVWFKAVYAIIRHGFVNMKRSMVAGQYHKPRGIFHGGTELQASHRLLRDFLREGGFFDIEGTVTWIDVHTGLGPRGLDTLMAHSTEEDPAVHFRDAPLPILSGLNKNTDKGTVDAGSGYDLSKGVTEDLYSELFTASRTRARAAAASDDEGGKEPMVVTQEFGTVNSVMVARALILENMAFHYATPAEHSRWAELTRDAFYVRSDDWRRSILARGLTVLSQAVSRSSSS